MPERHVLQNQQPRADDLLALPPSLRLLALAQSGVLTRQQANDHCVSRSATRSMLQATRWRAIGRHVLVLGNTPLTEEQRQWAAVLLFDKPVALAGPTAAAVGGLRGFASPQVHVVVRHDTHTAPPVWVTVHESRRFRPEDILRDGGPPRTTMTRSLIDTATWSPRPRRACSVLCAGVQQRLVTAPALSTELRRAGSVRHVAVMRTILGDIGGGGHTLAEIELGPLARAAGLPPPRRQVVRREPDGRKRYVDAEFDLPDGTVLVVEIDGAVHLHPEVYSDDLDRQNEIVIDGSPVLRFSSLSVRLQEQRVIDQLRRCRLAHSPR